MATWGYVRVSSDEQNVEYQVQKILPLVSDEQHLIVEICSGNDFERPEYQALKDKMVEHDILVISSIDRLGRNKELVKKELEDLKERNIEVNVLSGDDMLLNNSLMDSLFSAVSELESDADYLFDEYDELFTDELNDDEIELISMYRRFDDKQKELFLEHTKTLYDLLSTGSEN